MTNATTADTHATPIDDEGLWNMVVGPYETPESVLAECERENATPQDWLRSALDDAIGQGLVVTDDRGVAFSRLCRMAGVADG